MGAGNIQYHPEGFRGWSDADGITSMYREKSFLNDDFKNIRNEKTFLSSSSRASSPFESQLRTSCREFHPRRQLWELLSAGFKRWVVTLALVACLYGTLYDFDKKAVMSKQKKKVFNAMVTGLSIALGLNIQRSLKALAGEMRWWILSRHPRPLHEVDLILQSESLTHLCKLATVARRPKVVLSVGCWIMLNIASQIGVASLGLVFSTDTSDTLALTKPGQVSIPDMSTIITSKVISSASQAKLALQYTANLFGSSSVVGYGVTTDPVPEPGSLGLSVDYDLFQNDTACTYVFYDSSVVANDSKVDPIMIATDRTLSASGTCQSWPITVGGDGSSSNITVSIDGMSVDKILPVAVGTSQTTFETDPTIGCGVGCSTIEAFEAATDFPWYYICNVTVSNVTNARIPEHDVGIGLLNLASAAIALQGYGASSLSNNTNSQFQSYPAESSFGVPMNGSAEGMAMQLSRFAAGVISGTAYNNPNVIVAGMEPQLGVVLSIPKWSLVHVILIITVGVQLGLFLIAAFLAHNVMIKEDSYLAIARLLRPMVERMGDEGTTATANEICAVVGGHDEYIYSVKKSGEDVWQTDIGQERRVKAFPIGKYD